VLDKLSGTDRGGRREGMTEKDASPVMVFTQEGLDGFRARMAQLQASQTCPICGQSTWMLDNRVGAINYAGPRSARLTFVTICETCGAVQHYAIDRFPHSQQGVIVEGIDVGEEETPPEG
jgi:hypothetical protein